MYSSTDHHCHFVDVFRDSGLSWFSTIGRDLTPTVYLYSPSVISCLRADSSRVGYHFGYVLGDDGELRPVSLFFPV